MRKILLFSTILFVLHTNAAFSQDASFSLGANLLENQISGSYALQNNIALRVDVGFVLIDANMLSLNPKLLFHYPEKGYSLKDSGTIVPYTGPGIGLTFSTDRDVEYRFEYLVGLQYEVISTPMVLFMDAGPVISTTFNSSTFFGLTSSMGVRYQF